MQKNVRLKYSEYYNFIYSLINLVEKEIILKSLEISSNNEIKEYTLSILSEVSNFKV